MQVDIAQVIDEGRWTGYQKLLVAGTALAIIFDGVDNQLLGVSVSTLMDEWRLPRDAFTTALAMSPLGMLFGGAMGGWLGDRYGRRHVLLGSVLAFAAFTMAAAAANGVGMLSVLRFLAGLGLGAAMPTAAALASEYVPRRNRAFAVTLTIVCIPLGAMLAAFLSKHMIPAFGWRKFFLIGGIVPFVMGLLLFWVLAESPRYLAGRKDRWPELIALLRRMGHDIDPAATFVDVRSTPAEATRTAMQDLFSPEFRRDTFALFGSFFFCLLANYLAFQLMVPTLTGVGFTQPAASGFLVWWNVGGVCGALGTALLIKWFGSRSTMLVLSLVAIASAFVLAGMQLDPANSARLLVMSVVLGTSLNAVQTAMYALAAHVYPTRIRGTGIGTSVAVGRIGNILASYVGNTALNLGGASAYFATFGFAMIVVFLALAVVRRHIERADTRQKAMVTAAAD